MRRHVQYSAIGLVLALVVGTGVWSVYRERQTTIVVPVLSGGSVQAKTARAPGFFASIVRQIYGTAYSLRYFYKEESPVTIGSAQPDDAIAFWCPQGTNIRADRAIEKFSDGRNAWVWGEYDPDNAETTCVQNGGSQCFALNKFYGRAGLQYPFVDPNGVLTVPLAQAEGGLFFATADVPAGTLKKVRCAIPNPTVCGDDFIDSPELCDNGTANSNAQPDACRTNCVPAHCGDGVIDTGEQCDDNNSTGNDGCSATCQIESGWSCTGLPSSCSPNVPVGNPPSSAGGASSGITPVMSAVSSASGNASSTFPMGGSAGSSAQSSALPVCGNGIVEVGEQCDDGKTCGSMDVNGNFTGSGNWCTTNADCAIGEACDLHDKDGCNNAPSSQCKINLGYICVSSAAISPSNPPRPSRTFPVR